MSLKKIVNLTLLLATLLASFAITGNVLAWSGCGSTYAVQWGDTLASVAYKCGTTAAAIRQANPNLRYWLYAGQSISMPGYYANNSAYNNGYNNNTYNNGYNNGYSNTYNNAYNHSPQYYASNYSTSYAATRTYVVQWGDTLRKIADRTNINLNDLIAANPQLWNPNWIFAGQVINLPTPAQYYTVQYGDTLQIIAARFGTSLYSLESC